MITIVLSFYENGQMLDRHFSEWQKYTNKDSYRAIIVDDGSPTDPAKDHLKNVGFDIQLYRIKQNIAWNIPGARNLGMDRAKEGWCLLTDMDHLLAAPDADRLAEHEFKLRRGNFYMLARKWADGRPLNTHGNSFVLRREDYWKIGGVDEDFSGWWGAGERVFRANLRRVAQCINLTDVFLTHFGRGDIVDASTRDWTNGPPDYERRGTKWDWTNNPKLVAKSAPYKPINPLRFDWERVA